MIFLNHGFTVPVEGNLHSLARKKKPYFLFFALFLTFQFCLPMHQVIAAELKCNFPFLIDLKVDGKGSECKNSDWYAYEEAGDTVFIFVHGIRSDSVSAWLLKGSQGEAKSYWPELVRSDTRIGSPSVFIGGYYTKNLSGIYDIRNAAYDLMANISNERPDGLRPPIAKKNIVFIAHSMGGIVVRHMLTRAWNVEKFKDKNLYLALVASPSLGSDYGVAALLVSRLLETFGLTGNNAAEQLSSKYNSFLRELDADFLQVKNQNIYKNLRGIELVENFNYVQSLKKTVVPLESAIRYFSGKVVAGSDHSSIATPASNAVNSAHEDVVQFVKEAKANTSTAVEQRSVIFMDNYLYVYERNKVPTGEMNSHVIRRALRDRARDEPFISSLNLDRIEPVSFEWQGEGDIARAKADLVVIHYSALERKDGDRAGVERIKRFLNRVTELDKKVRIIVYGRNKSPEFQSEIRNMISDETSRSRVFAYAVPRSNGRSGSFQDAGTMDGLTQLMKRALEL